MKDIIAILTDFGQSEYLGTMKGAILSINPDCTIIDLYNGVQPQNVKQAAWLLRKNFQNFPEGTVFLCVIDPGVGTARKAVALKTSTGYFMVGPDNGLFWPFKEDIQEVIELTDISASTTFHGLDIFAPAAAKLSTGMIIGKLGRAVSLECETEYSLDPTTGKCELVHVDHYGNLITNLPVHRPFPLSKKFTLSIIEQSKFKVVIKDIPFIRTYNALMDVDIPHKKIVLIPSSYGTFEISYPNKSAQDILGLEIGTKILLLPDNSELLD